MKALVGEDGLWFKTDIKSPVCLVVEWAGILEWGIAAILISSITERMAKSKNAKGSALANRLRIGDCSSDF